MFIIEWLFPHRCAFCMAVGKMDICDTCQDTLPWVNTELATKHLAPLKYRGKVRAAIHRMKFRQSTHLANIFSLLMKQCLEDSRQEKPDIVTWVPSSFIRKRTRGYDPSKVLAAALSKRLCAQAENTLRKTRHTSSQRKMRGEAERRDNVKDAFSVIGNVYGKSILLVDDVITTGATIEECSKILRAAGAVRVITVAAAKK